jgi:hypothetical protein
LTPLSSQIGKGDRDRKRGKGKGDRYKEKEKGTGKRRKGDRNIFDTRFEFVTR